MVECWHAMQGVPGSNVGEAISNRRNEKGYHSLVGMEWLSTYMYDSCFTNNSEMEFK